MSTDSLSARLGQTRDWRKPAIGNAAGRLQHCTCDNTDAAAKPPHLVMTLAFGNASGSHFEMSEKKPWPWPSGMPRSALMLPPSSPTCTVRPVSSFTSTCFSRPVLPYTAGADTTTDALGARHSSQRMHQECTIVSNGTHTWVRPSHSTLHTWVWPSHSSQVWDPTHMWLSHTWTGRKSIPGDGERLSKKNCGTL
eukprot:364999-Chlamydomonas_euryale.AAC.23